MRSSYAREMRRSSRLQPGPSEHDRHEQQQRRNRRLLGGAQQHARGAGLAIGPHRLLDAHGERAGEGLELQVLDTRVAVDDDHQHAIARSEAQPLGRRGRLDARRHARVARRGLDPLADQARALRSRIAGETPHAEQLLTVEDHRGGLVRLLGLLRQW